VLEVPPNLASQRQPIVRIHPVTGRSSLYLCEDEQMDWHDGPIVGMEPGIHGDGAALVYDLMAHLTQRRFVYVHEWEPGDLIVSDNRSVIHAATWFDASAHSRIMWRSTVAGNPGLEYEGETPSWLTDQQHTD
jgi:taurine dioxygenase